jgi:hypothetical protein
MSVSVQIYEKIKEHNNEENMQLAANFKVFFEVIQKNENYSILIIPKDEFNETEDSRGEQRDLSSSY